MTCIPIRVTQAKRKNDLGAESFRLRSITLGALPAHFKVVVDLISRSRPSKPRELTIDAKRYGPAK
jgi:hypothetical protein